MAGNKEDIMAGKGSKRRPGNDKTYRDNWEKIFGKKK